MEINVKPIDSGTPEIARRRGALARPARGTSRRVIDHEPGVLRRVCPLARKSDFKTTRTIKALSLSPPTPIPAAIVALPFSPECAASRDFLTRVDRPSTPAAACPPPPPPIARLRLREGNLPMIITYSACGACLGNPLTRPIARPTTYSTTYWINHRAVPSPLILLLPPRLCCPVPFRCL